MRPRDPGRGRGAITLRHNHPSPRGRRRPFQRLRVQEYGRREGCYFTVVLRVPVRVK